MCLNVGPPGPCASGLWWYGVKLSQFLQLARADVLLGSNYCDFWQEGFGWPAGPLPLQTKEKQHNETCSNPTLVVPPPSGAGLLSRRTWGWLSPAVWLLAVGSRCAPVARVGPIGPTLCCRPRCWSCCSCSAPVGAAERAEPCTEH